MPDIGGALGLAGSLIGGSKASSGADAAVQAAAFDPYDVYGGVGQGVWEGQKATSSLAPEWQTKRDYYLDQADYFNQQLGQFTPPTLDQYITGYTGGAGPEAQSYEDWSAAQTGKRGFIENPNTMSFKEWLAEDLGSTYAEYTNSPYNQEDGGILAGKKLGELGEADTSQGAYDKYLAGLQGGRGDAIYDQEGYDAARAGWKSPEQRIYDRLFKMAEPGEAQQRSGLESRLFAQGMLGSTGGGQRTQALEGALGQKALGREQLSVQMSEEIQNMIQQRGLKATAAAMGIDEAALENIRLGMTAGGRQAAAGGTQAQILAQAGAQQGGAIANAFSGFGQNLSEGLFSGGSTPGFVPDYEAMNINLPGF